MFYNEIHKQQKFFRVIKMKIYGLKVEINDRFIKFILKIFM